MVRTKLADVKYFDWTYNPLFYPNDPVIRVPSNTSRPDGKPPPSEYNPAIAYRRYLKAGRLGTTDQLEQILNMYDGKLPGEYDSQIKNELERMRFANTPLDQQWADQLTRVQQNLKPTASIFSRSQPVPQPSDEVAKNLGPDTPLRKRFSSPVFPDIKYLNSEKTRTSFIRENPRAIIFDPNDSSSDERQSRLPRNNRQKINRKPHPRFVPGLPSVKREQSEDTDSGKLTNLEGLGVMPDTLDILRRNTQSTSGNCSGDEISFGSPSGLDISPPSEHRGSLSGSIHSSASAKGLDQEYLSSDAQELVTSVLKENKSTTIHIRTILSIPRHPNQKVVSSDQAAPQAGVAESNGTAELDCNGNPVVDLTNDHEGFVIAADKDQKSKITSNSYRKSSPNHIGRPSSRPLNSPGFSSNEVELVDMFRQAQNQRGFFDAFKTIATAFTRDDALSTSDLKTDAEDHPRLLSSRHLEGMDSRKKRSRRDSISTAEDTSDFTELRRSHSRSRSLTRRRSYDKRSRRYSRSPRRGKHSYHPSQRSHPKREYSESPAPDPRKKRRRLRRVDSPLSGPSRTKHIKRENHTSPTPSLSPKRKYKSRRSRHYDRHQYDDHHRD